MFRNFVRPFALFSAIALASFPAASQAELTYDIFLRSSLGDSFDSTFQVSPGITIQDAEIILRETVTSPSVPNIGTDGMLGVATMVATEGANGTFTNLQGNSAFQFAVAESPSVISRFLQAPFTQGEPTIDVGNGMFEITVGTLDITAPTTGATKFRLLDPFPTQENIEAFGSTPLLDDLIVFHDLTLTTVPEPGCAILLLGSLIAITPRRRRRVAD